MQKQEDRDITDSFAMKAKSIIHDIPKIGDKFTLSASNITLRARSFTAELSSKEYRDDKKNLVRPQRAYIYLHSDINPNGIT